MSLLQRRYVTSQGDTGHSPALEQMTGGLGYAFPFVGRVDDNVNTRQRMDGLLCEQLFVSDWVFSN